MSKDVPAKLGKVMIDGNKLDVDYQPNSEIDKAVFSQHITDKVACHSMSLRGTLHDCWLWQ